KDSNTELADNRLTAIRTGQNTATTILAIDSEAHGKGVSDSARYEITASFFLSDRNNQMVIRHETRDAAGVMQSFSVQDARTGFLMASSDAMGDWRDVTLRSIDQAAGTAVFDVIFSTVDAEGALQRVGVGTFNATLNADGSIYGIADTGTATIQVMSAGSLQDLNVIFSTRSSGMAMSNDNASFDAGDTFVSPFTGKEYTVKLVNDQKTAVATETKEFTTSDPLQHGSDRLVGTATLVYGLASVDAIRGTDEVNGKSGTTFKVINTAGEVTGTFNLRNGNQIALTGSSLQIRYGNIYSEAYNTHIINNIEIGGQGEGTPGQTTGGLNHINGWRNKQGEIITQGEITIINDKFTLTNNDAFYNKAERAITVNGIKLESGEKGVIAHDKLLKPEESSSKEVFGTQGSAVETITCVSFSNGVLATERTLDVNTKIYATTSKIETVNGNIETTTATYTTGHYEWKINDATGNLEMDHILTTGTITSSSVLTDAAGNQLRTYSSVITNGQTTQIQENIIKRHSETNVNINAKTGTKTVTTTDYISGTGAWALDEAGSLSAVKGNTVNKTSSSVLTDAAGNQLSKTNTVIVNGVTTQLDTAYYDPNNKQVITQSVRYDKDEKLTSSDWFVDGEKISVENFKKMGFDRTFKQNDGTVITRHYEFEKQVQGEKVTFEPVSLDEVKRDSGRWQTDVAVKKLDIRGVEYGIDNSNESVTFVRNINGDVVSLRGGVTVKDKVNLEPDMMMAGEIMLNLGDDSTLESQQKYNGVLLSSKDGKLKIEQSMVLLNGNSVQLDGENISILKGQAVTVTKLYTFMDKGKIVRSEGVPGAAGVTENTVRFSTVNGGIVIEENQLIDIENNNWVVNGGFLKNVGDTDVNFIDANNNLQTVHGNQRVHVVDGTFERREFGMKDVKDYDSGPLGLGHIAREALELPGKITEKVFGEQENKKLWVTNKATGLWKSVTGFVGTGLLAIGSAMSEADAIISGRLMLETEGLDAKEFSKRVDSYYNSATVNSKTMDGLIERWGEGVMLLKGDFNKDGTFKHKVAELTVEDMAIPAGILAAVPMAAYLIAGAPVAASGIFSGSGTLGGLFSSGVAIGASFVAFDNAISIAMGKGLQSMTDNVKSFFSGALLAVGLGAGTAAANWVLKQGTRSALLGFASSESTGAKILKSMFASVGGGSGLTAIGAVNRIMAISPLNDKGEVSIGEYFKNIGSSLVDYFTKGGFSLRDNEAIQHFVIGAAMLIVLEGVGAAMNKLRPNSKITERFFANQKYVETSTEQIMLTGSNIAERVGGAALKGAKDFLLVGPSFFAITTGIENLANLGSEINSWFSSQEHNFLQEFSWQGKKNGMGFWQSMLVSTLQMGKLGLWLGPAMPIFQRKRLLTAESAADTKVIQQLANLSKTELKIKQFISGPAAVATILGTASTLSKALIEAIDKGIPLFNNLTPDQKQAAIESLANDIAFFVLMNKPEYQEQMSKARFQFETKGSIPTKKLFTGEIVEYKDGLVARSKVQDRKGVKELSKELLNLASVSLYEGKSAAQIQGISNIGLDKGISGAEIKTAIKEKLPELTGDLTDTAVSALLNTASNINTGNRIALAAIILTSKSDKDVVSVATVKEGTKLENVTGIDRILSKDMQTKFKGFEIDSELQSNLKGNFSNRIAEKELSGGVTANGAVKDSLVDTFLNKIGLDPTSENIQFGREVLQKKINTLEAREKNYNSAKTQTTVSEKNLNDLGIKDTSLIGKDAAYVRTRLQDTTLSAKEIRTLEALAARLEKAELNLEVADIDLKMAKIGSLDPEYKNLNTNRDNAISRRNEADIKVKTAEKYLEGEEKTEVLRDMFSQMSEDSIYNFDARQLKQAFGPMDKTELNNLLDILLKSNKEQLAKIQSAFEKKIELFTAVEVIGIKEGKHSKTYFDALVEYGTQSKVTDKIVKGETVTAKEREAIKKQVNKDFNLMRDFISRLDTSKVEEVIREYKYVEYGNEQISELVDKNLVEAIENLGLKSKDKQIILDRTAKLKKALMTDAKDDTGRRWELLQNETNFKEFLKLTDQQAEELDTVRQTIYKECTKQLSFEKFLESKGKNIEELKKSAEGKIKNGLNLSPDEALIYVESSLKELMNKGNETGQERYLNLDQIEAVLTFMEGKSIEQKAGAGKTEVALTYMEIMSLVHGKDFRGIILTDSSVASSRYMNTDFAGTKGLTTKAVLDSMGGRKLVNGSELFAKGEYKELLKALENPETIVVIDYTSFGHMHNLYYGALELVEAIENINLMVADEIHMSVSGNQAYISSAEGTPVSQLRRDKIDVLRKELKNSEKAESYDALRSAKSNEEMAFYNAQERLYGVSEALRYRLKEQGLEVNGKTVKFEEYEIDSVLRGLRDVEKINESNSFGVEEEMIHPTSDTGRIMTDSRISDVDYTIALAQELNSKARVGYEAKVEQAKRDGTENQLEEYKDIVDMNKITEADTDRHTSLLEIFDKNATILGMTATAQGRISLIMAGIRTEVKTISRTTFSLENFTKLGSENDVAITLYDLIENGLIEIKKDNIIIASPDPATRSRLTRLIEKNFGSQVEIIRVEPNAISRIVNGKEKIEVESSDKARFDNYFNEEIAGKAYEKSEDGKIRVFITNEMGFTGTNWKGDLSLIVVDTKGQLNETNFSQLSERVGRTKPDGTRYNARRYVLLDETTTQSIKENLIRHLEGNKEIQTELKEMWTGEIYKDADVVKLLDSYLKGEDLANEQLYNLNAKVNEAVSRSEATEFVMGDQSRNELIVKQLKLMIRDAGIISEGNKDTINNMLKEVINRGKGGDVTPGKKEIIKGEEISRQISDRVIDEALDVFTEIKKKVSGERTEGVVDNRIELLKELKNGSTKVGDVLRIFEALGKDLLSREGNKQGRAQVTSQEMGKGIEEAYKKNKIDISNKEGINDLAEQFISGVSSNGGSARLSVILEYSKAYIGGISLLKDDKDKEALVNAIESLINSEGWEETSDRMKMVMITNLYNQTLTSLPNNLSDKEKHQIGTQFIKAINPLLDANIIDSANIIYSALTAIDSSLADDNDKANLDVIIPIVAADNPQAVFNRFVVDNTADQKLAKKIQGIKSQLNTVGDVAKSAKDNKLTSQQVLTIFDFKQAISGNAEAFEHIANILKNSFGESQIDNMPIRTITGLIKNGMIDDTGFRNLVVFEIENIKFAGSKEAEKMAVIQEVRLLGDQTIVVEGHSYAQESNPALNKVMELSEKMAQLFDRQEQDPQFQLLVANLVVPGVTEAKLTQAKVLNNLPLLSDVKDKLTFENLANFDTMTQDGKKAVLNVLAGGDKKKAGELQILRVQGRFDAGQVIGMINMLPNSFSEPQKTAVFNWLCGTNVSENDNNLLRAALAKDENKIYAAFGNLTKVITNKDSKLEERNKARLQFAQLSLQSGRRLKQGAEYAKAVINELDSSDPQNVRTFVQAHLILGQIYNKQGDIQQHIKQLEKAVVLLEKQPESVASENQQMIKSLYRDLGSLYIQEKSFRQAQQYFNKIIEMTPEKERGEITDIYFTLAQAQREIGDLTGAAQTYEKVKELAGNTHDAMSIGIAAGNLGAVYMQQGKQSEALRAYDDAINKFGEILSNLLKTPNVTTKEVQPPKVMLAAVTVLKKMAEEGKVLATPDINKIINEDLNKFNIAGQKGEILGYILQLTYSSAAYRNIYTKTSQNATADGKISISRMELAPLMQEFAGSINPQNPDKAVGLAYWSFGFKLDNLDTHKFSMTLAQEAQFGEKAQPKTSATIGNVNVAGPVDGFEVNNYEARVSEEEFNADFDFLTEDMIIERGENNAAVISRSLQENGLGAKHEFVINGKTVYASDAFTLDKLDGRPGVVLYVMGDYGKTINLRLAYKSNSQNEWRIVSHIAREDQTSKEVQWLGKGKGEEGMTLKIGISTYLDNLDNIGTVKNEDIVLWIPINVAISGLAKRFAYAKTFGGADSLIQLFNNTGEVRNTANAPDFIKGIVNDTAFHNEAYNGALIRTIVVKSKNSGYLYRFHHDTQHDISWMGTVEKTNSGVTDYGLNVEQVNLITVANDFIAPGIEYPSQVRGSRDKRMIGDYYMDNSEYTHSLPLVSSFRSWLLSKGNLIGKILNEYGEVITGFTGIRNSQNSALLLQDTNGKIMAQIPIVGKVDIRQAHGMIGQLKDKMDSLSGDKKEIGGIIKRVEAGIDNIYLLDENNSQGIIGFGDENSIYLGSTLLADPAYGIMLLFHEAGEAFFAANPGSIPITGISAHIYLRGCGEDVRRAADTVVKNVRKENINTADKFVNEIKSQLRNDKARQMSAEEEQLIRAQYNTVSKPQEAAYGLQDRLFGEKVNVGFTEKIKVIRGKMVIARLAMPTTVVT
ncbi:MAG: hypothetical protein ABII75_08845, partial [Candidatus Omnitrophota bacterium]